jgi:hypothetical protein
VAATRDSNVTGSYGELAVPATGIFWGAEDQATNQNFTGTNGIETVTGYKMAIRRQHYSWASGPAAMPTSFETANDKLTNPQVIHMVAQRGDGNFPVVVKGTGPNGNGWSSTNDAKNTLGHNGMQRIVDGDFDTGFTSQFTGLKTLNNPVLYNLWFECNGAHNNYYSLAQGGAGGSRYSPGTGEAVYRDAYRHVRGLADSAGASISHGGNVIFIWCIQCDNSSGWFQNYYPGDAYVDWIGIDLYRRTCSSGMNLASPSIGAGDNLLYPFAMGTQSGLPAVSRGTTAKPVIVCEAGYGNGIAYVNNGATGDGTSYYKDSTPFVENLLNTDFQNDYINVVAYVHWNEPGITDNHVNQSANSLAAYKTWLGKSWSQNYYGGTGGGSPPPTPTITGSSKPSNPTTSTSNTFQWTDVGGTPAVPFDGGAFQRIETPNVSHALDVNHFTISAWVNPDYSTDTDPVSQRIEICEKSGCFWFNIRWDSNPLHLLRVGGYFGSTSNATDTFTGNTPIAGGVWTHVAATYDGTNLSTYINGALDAQLAQTGTTETGTAVTGVDEKLVVGAKHRIGSGELLQAFWNGGMAQFKLFSTALSTSNIALLAAGNYSATTPVVDYEFTSISGATVNDQSGNGNTGTGQRGAVGSATNWSPSTETGPYGAAPDHYRYRITTDGTPGSWTTTSSTNSGSLSFPAGHTYKFEVQAGNSTNQYSSSDSYTWTVNTSGSIATPVITINPPSSTAENTAIFEWTESGADSSYRYFIKVDTPSGTGTYPATGQKELIYNVPGTPLATGAYKFYVKAYNGTSYSSEATYSWTIAATGAGLPKPPLFTSVPPDPDTNANPTIVWSQP